ncbi:MAG TPA: sigma-70 family RNA polymerase sigma factor [Mycobacteriales bacterium]|nr:sigma-70 family RNA polymerase sigma factor [Mycobacteriales bacterium]
MGADPPLEAPLDADVLAAQRGDRAALERVLVEVRRGALRYLLARRIPLGDAEDIAQEVCVSVINVMPGWQDQGRPFWAYVFTVVRGRVADRARRAARGRETTTEQLPERADTGSGPEELAVLRESSAGLAALLDRLPPTQRDALVLRVIVGLSPAEVAEALGLAHGSVHVLVNRAVNKLRTLMAADAVVAP